MRCLIDFSERGKGAGSLFGQAVGKSRESKIGEKTPDPIVFGTVIEQTSRKHMYSIAR